METGEAKGGGGIDVGSVAVEGGRDGGVVAVK